MPTVGIPQPPPYKGQNDQFPLFSIQNPYCERLENFNNKGGALNLRKGNDRFAWGFPGTTAKGAGIFKYEGSTEKLFSLIHDNTGSTLKWYDITAGGSFTTADHTETVSNNEWEIKTLFFNDYLFFMGKVNLKPGGSVGIVYYNGSAFGIASYTWPTARIPYGGNIYKSRAYFKANTRPYYMYTNIDAVSGAVTGVDLSSVVSRGGDLYGIKSISVSESVSPDNLQSFILSTGEILVYSGSFPNAANWQIVSRFIVSEPIYHDTMIDAKGDTFILTKTEILSLRNLYTGGYNKEQEEGIGATIKNRWSQIVSAITNSTGQIYSISGKYDGATDRLVINLPYWVDPITSAVEEIPFQLIYDFDLGCWYEYFQAAPVETREFLAKSMEYFNDTVYVQVEEAINYSVNIMALDSVSTYMDDKIDTTGTTAISYKIRSAPAPYDKFGVMITQGLELIMKSDIYNTMLFKLIGNLGADETEQQNLEPPAGVDGLVYKAFVDIGIEGNVVQWELTGDSASSSCGIQIFATNLWLGAPSGEGVQR